MLLFLFWNPEMFHFNYNFLNFFYYNFYLFLSKSVQIKISFEGKTRARGPLNIVVDYAGPQSRDILV